MVKTRNFDQNRNCGQKSKFWPQIEIVIKIETFVKNRNFDQNRKLRQKWKLWPKSKLWSKIEIYSKIEIRNPEIIENFLHKFCFEIFQLKIRFLTKMSVFENQF